MEARTVCTLTDHPRCPSHPDAFIAYFPWEGYHRCTKCEWNTAPGQKWPDVFTFGSGQKGETSTM